MEHDPKDSLDPAPLRALAAAICELDAPARIAADLPGFLAAHGVRGADLEDLARRGERLLMYRAMVQSRLRGLVADYLPRVAELLGKDRLRADMAAFMAERAPRSPYFRDVTGEFVAWAAPRWAADPTLPAYLADLARHEWLDGEVGHCAGGGEPETDVPLALDRPVVLDGSTRVTAYDFAVQRLGDEVTEPPAREATNLLAYRDRDTHRVRFLELTPRASATCRRLLAGEALQSALQGACDDVGEAMSDEFLAAMAGFLTDLGERKVLLGARSDTGPGA